MMVMRFNEKEFVVELDEKRKYDFLKRIEAYDANIAARMRIAGYKRINQTERTVTFTFGEITFPDHAGGKEVKNLAPPMSG